MSRGTDTAADEAHVRALLTREAGVALGCVLLGTALWYGAMALVANRWLPWVILIGVGVILPTVLTERLG
jgi:hypothetical protein